jgi:hypothetical protein
MMAPVTPAWSADELAVVDAPPHALAQQLAILASELPGFDCADRAYLRRAALALSPMQGNREEALRLVRQAVAARAGVGSQRARPEAVFLEAVLWLLARERAGEAAH